MSQSLEFSATAGLTLTATACAVGSYTGTAATSVTQQSGTDRYLAVFGTNLTAGAYRLDYALSGSPLGSEVYDVSGSGTFQPRGEALSNVPDLVWDEATSSHATAGTTGAAITTASTAVSVTVLPATGTEASRVTGTAIQLFTAELTTVAVAVTDSAGAAVDMTGLTLELVFESGATEVVIVDADIGKTTSSFSFTATSALTTSERLWKWALRDTSNESVIVHGTLEVVYAANN